MKNLNESLMGPLSKALAAGVLIALCNRHGILRSSDRGKTYDLVHKTSGRKSLNAGRESR